MQFCKLHPQEVILEQPALLALEDGSVFKGRAFGAYPPNGTSHYVLGEVVFNTALTGYQEVMTDPSYSNQLIAFTYPHIGNVGINKSDFESQHVQAAGLIVARTPTSPSNWQSISSLNDFLIKSNKIGIAEIDTRALTQLIREKGALKGCLYTANQLTTQDELKAIKLAQAFEGLEGKNLAQLVSTQNAFQWEEGLWQQEIKSSLPLSHVVVYDFGAKSSILRSLKHLNCNIKVVPAHTPAHIVLEQNPDGVLFSNGPGDPAACHQEIQIIKKFLEHRVPLFGICLGFQLLALASGARTIKMKFGHHGTNHPVKEIETGQVLITSQNHGFAVDADSLGSEWISTHYSLFDNTLQGFKHKKRHIMGFQGHPEAGPGPNEGRILFNQFKLMMNNYSHAKKLNEVAN